MTGFNALTQILDEPCFDKSDYIPEDTSQSSDHPKSKLDYALESAKYGFKVFPIHGIIKGRCTCNEGESCKSPGKHPLHSGWKTEATTDPDRIREIWSEYPHANIGIKTGIESNNVVIDIDPRHGGDESLRELEAEYGKLPDTVESLTGGGGRHIIFGHPGGYISNKQNFLLPGIDIRGDGGFIVAPGSIHLSGNRYEWDVMCHPEDVSLADMPSWLIDKLKSPSGGNEAHSPASEQARELLNKLCDKCEFIRWCKDNQAEVSESLWYSGISNVSRISPGGPALCHEISCEYPKYNYKETQDKIFQSLNNSNPHTCEHINQNGYNCGSRCYVKSPIAWLNPIITKELLSEDGDPVPFTKSQEKCVPFPVDAFPELIKDVIDEYAPYGQQPLPMIATSALSVVSLVTQGHADVARDDYLKGPISLNTNVIAESGERKTAADNHFRSEAMKWVQENKQKAHDDMRDTVAKRKLWESKTKAILAQIDKGIEKKQEILPELEKAYMDLQKDEPSRVIEPELFYGDVNPASLGERLTNGYPVGSLWTDEGAIVIGSNGMNPDNVFQFVAMRNKLWDNGTYSNYRKTSGSTEIINKRFSSSIMMQRRIFQEMLMGHGKLTRGIGLMARDLMCEPESTQGSREYKKPTSGMPAKAAFDKRVRQLLSMPLRLNQDGSLNPVVLTFEPDAQEVWINFHNDIERELKRFGTFEEIRDFASKAAENMARIAACIQVFVNGPSGRISKDMAINAGKIALWYLNEARRILCLYHKTEVEQDAETLLNWFIEKGYQETEVKASDLLRYGPNQLRDKKRRDAALKLLVEHRCILQTGSPINKAVLRLHPKAGEVLK